MDVLQLKARLQSVNIPQLAAASVKMTATDMVEWQRDQLWSGKTSTGGWIRPPYHPITRKIKAAKGQPTNRVTLYDKGDVHEATTVDINLQEWTLYSKDWKAPMLIEKYTPQIFGLNKISLLGYISDVRPVFMRLVSKSTGLPL